MTIAKYTNERHDRFLAPPARISTSVAIRAAHGETGPCGDAARVTTLIDGRIGLAVVDIAGHGAPCATISAKVLNILFNSLALDASPAIALVEADRYMRQAPLENPYAVAFVAVMNPLTRTVAWASAGHELAFMLHEDGARYDLHATSPMLGIPLTLRPCEAVTGPLRTLVVATDGVGDSRPPHSNDFFGTARAADAVRAVLRTDDDPASHLLRVADEHGRNQQRDDAAAIVARMPHVS